VVGSVGKRILRLGHLGREAVRWSAVSSCVTSCVCFFAIVILSRSDDGNDIMSDDQSNSGGPHDPGDGHYDSVPPIWQSIIELGASLRAEEWDCIPTDLAANLHRYLYGRRAEECGRDGERASRLLPPWRLARR
jgi:hypothetical protein